MRIPDMVAPNRGSVTSRYLQAISSCGAQDVNMSGLSMPATPPSSRWKTPTKLNSSGMTAPTAEDASPSGSWTTMETRRSRSERHRSRRANTDTPNSGITATTATEPAIRLGFEDDCSSIESTSNHRRPQQASRPAHLSLEETNNSMEDSFRSINQTLEPHSLYPMSRQHTKSPATRGIFPKTSPGKGTTPPTRLIQQPYHPSTLSQPYRMSRSTKSIAPKQLAPNKQYNVNKSAPNTPSSSSGSSKSPAESPLRANVDGADAPTEVMMNLTSARKFRLQPQWDPSPSTTRYPPNNSDDGAPTEIMTNRAKDIMMRYQKARTLPRPNPKPAGVMHSLMDDSMDSISNASGSVKSPDQKSQHFTSALLSPPAVAASTRLSQHMMEEKVASRAHYPSSAPDEEDGSFQKSLNSVGVEIGANNMHHMHMTPRPPPVFGGRQVTGGPPRRMHPTIRALQQAPPPPPPPPPPCHLPRQEQHPTQQQQHRPEPAQYENKDIALPPYTDAHKEGKALSNTSSNPFTVYKTEQTRMEDAFPKRTFSEASSGWTPITLSDQDPNNSQQRNGKSPIMSVFSKDRLDLSFGTQSPIRKMRSHSMTNKEPLDAQEAESLRTLTRSNSSSEVIARQHQQLQQQQSLERIVDPIFCPGGSMSFASSKGTYNNGTSIFSQSTVQTQEPGGEFEVKRSVIRTWPPPKEDESCVESELVEILENGYKRRKGTSKPYGYSNPPLSVQKSTEHQLYGVPSLGSQRRMSTPASSPPKQEFPNSPNDSEDAMWNQMSGRRSQASETYSAKQQRKVHGSDKSHISVSSSVRDKIRAFNMGAPNPKSHEASPSRSLSLHRAAWKPARYSSSQGNNNSYAGDLTSRQMLVTSAHLACMSNDVDEDDDMASVKSLRERFEYPQSARQHRDIDVYDNDDMSSLKSMLDDDTASVRSLRERFGQNSHQGLEIYDDDDDTASIKSLRDRFEGAPPAKEPVENGISKLRARFEKKPIEARGKIVLQGDNSWMDNDYKSSQPPLSITAKNQSKKRTDRVSTSSLPPNAPPPLQAGGAADGGDNAKAEVTAGILESREGMNIPTMDAKMSATHPQESLSNLEGLSGKHVGVGEDRAVVNQKDAPAFSPGPADHSRKALALPPQSKSAAIEPDPIFVASPDKINNMGVQRRAIPFGVAKEPSTPSKDRSIPGPISSPFQSMRDRMNMLSKSRNGKPLGLHERRSTARNFSRWASNRREDKLTPLAAQDSKAPINQERIGGVISRANSYDLAPVAQPEPETISQHERAATLSKPDDRSFDDFFSRTNKLLREKQQQEAKSTTTPRHSNRDVQAGNQRISNHPAGDARASNRNDIFRSESKAETPEPPGSHWTVQADKPRAKLPESKDKRGLSTESEFSDGVTLDLSIADVSNITNPTAIRSKASKEADQQSSTSSSTEDIMAKKSEASSSQPSEAAAPLIAASMRLLSDDMSGLIRHQNNQGREKNFDARNEKSRTGIGQVDTKGFGEIGWDIQHVQSSFPLQTPSFENLFNIDPGVEDFASDWLAFDNNDTAWANAPRGTADDNDGNDGMEEKSKPSSRPTTPAAERALRSTEQLNSSYDLFTKPVASTSQPTTPDRPSAIQTTAPIRLAALPAMASQNAPTEAHRPKNPTREMTSNPTTSPQQAVRVLSAYRDVQPITPTREPEAASDRHMLFRPATPSREASTSNAFGPDPTTPQAVTPTFHKSVPTRHTLLQNSQQASPSSRSPHHRSVQSQESSSLRSKKSHQPINAREERAPSFDTMATQNYIAPDFQQPIRHQTGQPVMSPRKPVGHKLPAVTPSPHRPMPSYHEHTQNQHLSYAHQTPSNIQRQDIQNNRPRTPTRQPLVPASSLSTSDPDYATIMEARHQMLLSRQRTLQQRKAARQSATHVSNQYPTTSPSTFSAFGGSPPPPPPPPRYPRTSAPNYGMPDPMQTPTGAGFFGRTHPEQALTQRPHPGKSYVPSRLTPPEPPFQHPSNASEGRGLPINPATRTSEAQLKPKSTPPHKKTPPWQVPQSSPGQSIYNQVTTRLGLGSTGESDNAVLFAKLNKLKESRMRRSAGRSAPSMHPVEQRQEHHQSMSSGPTMTNSYAWQHHDDTGDRPPRSTMNDLTSPFSRQAAPGSSWPDLQNYGSPDDFSVSTKSMNQFFEASLEVD